MKSIETVGILGVDAVRQARLLWAYRIGGNMGTYSNLTWQLLVQFLIVLFLVVAVSGLAVGVGLIASSPKIVGYFHTLNRWVSTRHVTRSWDDMHMNLDALVEAHPKPAGWIITCTSAAAVICAVIMLARYY